MSSEIVFSATDEECSSWGMSLPDYNANFVAELKNSIPPSHRYWQPEEKAWVVTNDWAEHASNVAKKHFPRADVRWVEI